MACQQSWQHVWSCAHTYQQPTEPFAHCQAPACDDCNTHSSELPKEGTCNHAAGPASTCPALCRYAGYCDINFFSTTLSRFRAILQHQWCLMGNVICYWQLLGLASSCRLIMLLVFELLNSGLHASTRQLTSLHTACMHRQGSEQVCIMNHKPTEDCY